VNPLKLWLANRLHDPRVGKLAGLVFQDRIPFYGARVDTSEAAVADQIKAMLLWRMYESGEVRFVRKYLRPDLDVIELGSSIGAMATQILSIIDRDRRLVCVEANPALLASIRKNVDTRATVIHAAVAYEQKDTVELALGESSLGSAVKADRAAGRSVTVPAKTLRQIHHSAGLGRFALVCDIEGAEHDLFALDPVVLGQCEQIVIELHDVSSSSDGRLKTVERLASSIRTDHGFRQLARYGPVCVYQRS
jgi:FkbM family methyltransferase